MAISALTILFLLFLGTKKKLLIPSKNTIDNRNELHIYRQNDK